MPLPPKLRAKLLARLDELIGEGEDIAAKIKVETIDRGERWSPRYKKCEAIDWPRFVRWRTNSKSVLAAVVPNAHAHREATDSFGNLCNRRDDLEYGVSFLTAVRDDFEHGFLDGVSEQVEAEITADYMGQAERLLDEGQTGKHDHVPAAVLSGAVLEKALRTLCSKQMPPVPTTKPNGSPIMLNGLIVALKKAGVYNELKAKQLRAWAAIRNHAAHGEFDDFKRSDVEHMIRSINTFLADSMG